MSDFKRNYGDAWAVTATDSTAATATKTGVASKTYYITDICASSDKAGSIILVKDGTTVIWQAQVGATFFSHHFSTPLVVTTGASAIVTIDSTSAGKANIAGYTI